ncbi:MAG: enoyl-CoA hydratase [Candidatus Neomarinimicrobiota bacterium]|nr:enoyl-CoA hydratase [Candidatus Neomarinimicrobiota bacterium]|tara:strand:+ start:183 stop:971 length:789 start_codon:yes stop_codon:yes gene_type:complete
MSDYVKIDSEDSILKIGFNRPDKKNALNSEMYYAVRDALVSASEDSSVRVIVLYGEGGDFTSGNDVKDFLAFATTKISEGNDSEFPAKEFLDVLIPYNKPVIAAVDGVAVGIGATLTQHCDLVYASKEAKFHMPFVNLGLNPEAGTSFVLPKLVGYHNAAEILLSGDMFTSQRAHEMGFVNGVVEQSELMDFVMNKAKNISELAPTPVRLAKQMMKEHFVDQLIEVNQKEFNTFVERMKSPEALEAIQAFIQKRKPDFSQFD